MDMKNLSLLGFASLLLQTKNEKIKKLEIKMSNLKIEGSEKKKRGDVESS